MNLAFGQGLLKSKSIKKLKRILLWLLGILVFLVCLVFLVLQVDTVQTWLGRRVTSYLSSELNAKISVERVSIRLVKSVVLNGVYVEDQHGDTLVWLDELNASIGSISTNKHLLKISKLSLSKGQFNLTRYHGEEHDNIQFLSDYFASTDTTPSAPWDLRVTALVLEDMTFRRQVEDDTAKVFGVDFEHLDVSGINGKFSNFYTKNDSIFTVISGLRFKEASGFQVDEFSADAKVSTTEIRMNGLVIKSPNTNLSTDLVFQYDSFPDFDEFTHNIRWKSDFRNSTVSFKDISYFATDLQGIDKKVKLDGLFKGSVNKFKGKNVRIEWGDHSFFKGSVAINGLPEIEDTYFDVDAQEIFTTKKDIETIPVDPFTEKNHVVVPENFACLGDVSFKGRFNGFYNDFVAYGTINTAIGMISSDLNMKYDIKKKSTYYSGHLSSNRFDVGQIAKIKDMGRVTLSVNVKGNGLRLENVNATLNGGIDALVYRGYEYHNIKVDGQIAKKLFNGAVSVDEPNLALDFKGTIDYRKPLPEFDFLADIKNAELEKLNLFKLTGETSIQSRISTHFKGNRSDNIVGDIQIENTSFQSGMSLYHINTISINSEIESGFRSIDITSDNFDAHFKGSFEFATLGDAFKEILPQYLPSVILPKKSFVSNQNFTYSIRLKNLNVFTETLFPSWDFAPNTELKGHFNSSSKDFNLDLTTPYIRYKKFTFQNLNVVAAAANDRLDVNAKSTRVLNDQEVSVVELPSLSAVAKNNQVLFTLRLADEDTFVNRGHLEGEFNFFSASKFNFKIDSSYIVLENHPWSLDKNNFVEIDSSKIDIRKLHFSRDVESISLGGIISKNPSDKLNISLSGFSLEHLNTILKTEKGLFGGLMDGSINLSDVYSKPQLEGDININSFSINADTIGNVAIHSNYNSDKEILSSSILAIKGTAKIIDIKGDYYVTKEEDNIDYDVKLNNLYIHPIERYISDIMSNVYGKVTADLHMGGTFNRPEFKGTVDLNKASLKVNYLQTHYSFSTSVRVEKDRFVIKDMHLTDDNNQEALVNGTVTHSNFHDFRFDAEMNATKFQILHTEAKDNSLYYGTANASGYAKFYGPIANMNMDISLSPDKGTVVNIPLNTYSDISKNEFITFIDHRAEAAKSNRGSHVDLSGVRLNMNLDMNRNAIMNIIFDEKIGDVITGSGTGSLRLDINTAGNFNMYGTYTIETGDYLFTLQNLINKKFTIDNGSRIT
ncbi:MAG: translocation/assembly module TamB domain-containing protein [Bacteroidetes bacterium]|nr:translocation/assembly module TamB domain-containing protein [Bacteroidota bacterium]